MMYKDGKFGWTYDLDSEELPPQVKKSISKYNVSCIICSAALFLINSFILRSKMVACLSVLCLLRGIFGTQISTKRYYKRRKAVLDKKARGIEIKSEEEKEADLKRERYMRCNVCGHIFCYTNADIEKDLKQSAMAGIAVIGALASIVGGTRYDMYEQGKILDRESAKIKDFSRCPHCNSTNITEISPDEATKSEKASRSFTQISSADEVKKFKELLDSGVITQEEFDAKKKQLLGV